MRRIGRLVGAIALVLGVSFAMPSGTQAHALLQTSDPAAGSTVAASPAVVVLTFGEQPDPSLSSVKVLDTSGRNVASGPAAAVPGSPDELQVPLPSLPDGVYTVSWRTVSVVDGHTAVGSFAFGVGVAPGTGGGGGGSVTSSPSSSPQDIGARFLLLLGLVLLFGSGFVGAVVHEGPSRPLRWMAGFGWLLAAVGTVTVVGLQAIDAGSDAGAFIGSALGAWAVRRVILVAVTGVIVGTALGRPGSANRWRDAMIAGSAVALMLLDVLTGHAAVNGLVSIDVAVQSVHLLAAGVWMGGLAGLLLAIRGEPTDQKARAARRFSRWAAAALVGIAVTGVIRAVQEVGTIDNLTSTDYGRVVIAKSVLLIVLGGLGAINHFGSVPLTSWTLVPLRRVGRAELATGIVVLLATGLLVSLAPPASYGASQGPPAPAPVIVSGNDFGTSVRVKLVIKPGTPGLNDFSAALTDFDSGAPVTATAVTLRFSLASATGVGGSTLVLPATGAGAYDASGGNLSLDGIWKVTVVVAGPSGTVEVPLSLATRTAAQQVDINAVTGLPTVYTVHLAAGDELQVYLDPGTPGPNELHATFFDLAGNELPVQTATFLLEPGAADPTVVAGRQLEPGHFVTDLQADAGALGVDVVGPAPDGSTLHAHVDLTVHP
jgi:putative copper export protein/methionine-rich copper-binding protein CopC